MNARKLRNAKRRLARYAKQIKDRERRFKKMNKAQRRLAIARDVIEALKDNKIKAVKDHFITSRKFDEVFDRQKDRWDRTDEKKRTEEGKKQLQEVLVNMPTCSACAVGSMFRCAILRNDKITVKQFADLSNSENNEGYAMQKYLGKFFNDGQIWLIEKAFELGEGGLHNGDPNSNEFYDAVAFGRQFKTPRERMTAIMKNIISNKGVFIPPKDEDEVSPSVDF